MNLTENFKPAIQDYRLLLAKGYPQKATLKLVSDRYTLNSTERSILFRGVTVNKKAVMRIEKTINKIPENETVVIDGFNVLRTIASYLLGRPVYIALDGFLRDASELHGKALSQEWRYKALALTLDIFRHGKNTLEFWFDSPVSKSGETAAEVNRQLETFNITGKAETTLSADYRLKTAEKGLIATADSAIIEQSKVPVIDLAQLVLNSHYEPSFFDLRTLVGF